MIIVIRKKEISGNMKDVGEIEFDFFALTSLSVASTAIPFSV
jgi:hypothetical protein